ncbi:MAG: hypothetical protein WKF60_12045, partial [Ilumatobacter sp.]
MADHTDQPEPTATPFERLTDFVAVPRLAGLALSNDGERLVTSVSTLASDRKTWQTALWEIDLNGEADARRLTRSAPGESAPVFAPDGSLLFTSKRRDPAAKPDADDPEASLWSLPAGAGEARLVLAPPAGVGRVDIARDTGDVVLLAPSTPGSADLDVDKQRRDARKDAGVTAILHEAYPVRFWDHDLGPALPHVFWLGRVPAEGEFTTVRDLMPDIASPYGAGEEVAVSPDGRLVA